MTELFTKFDQDFLRRSITKEFHSCKEWELEKSVRLIDLARKLKMPGLVEELEGIIKEEFQLIKQY